MPDKERKREGDRTRKPVTAGELRRNRNRVSHFESKSKCEMQNANHYFGQSGSCSSRCMRTCLLRWLPLSACTPLLLSLSRTYCCHSLVCRGCLSTSHCGTFRLSIALGQLIDAHKSVKRVRRGGSRQTLEEARREGDSSSLSLCLSSSRSFCMPNHCSRKLENFQLTVNFLPLQLPQSNT